MFAVHVQLPPPVPFPSWSKSKNKVKTLKYINKTCNDILMKSFQVHYLFLFIKSITRQYQKIIVKCKCKNAV